VDAIIALKTRRSVRSFENRPVAREIIEDIIDCGRLAASAINIQPWEFVVVTEPRLKRQIAETTDHGRFLAEARLRGGLEPRHQVLPGGRKRGNPEHPGGGASPRLGFLLDRRR
jgi:nitroreductase